MKLSSLLTPDRVLIGVKEKDKDKKKQKPKPKKAKRSYGERITW